MPANILSDYLAEIAGIRATRAGTGEVSRSGALAGTLDAMQLRTIVAVREITEVDDGQDDISHPATGGFAQDGGGAASRRRSRQDHDA